MITNTNVLMNGRHFLQHNRQSCQLHYAPVFPCREHSTQPTIQSVANVICAILHTTHVFTAAGLFSKLCYLMKNCKRALHKVRQSFITLSQQQITFLRDFYITKQFPVLTDGWLSFKQPSSAQTANSRVTVSSVISEV